MTRHGTTSTPTDTEGSEMEDVTHEEIEAWARWSIEEQGVDPAAWVANLASMSPEVAEILGEAMAGDIAAGDYSR